MLLPSGSTVPVGLEGGWEVVFQDTQVLGVRGLDSPSAVLGS